MSKARKRRAVLEDAGMYRMNRQMRIEDFVFPYGQLDKGTSSWMPPAVRLTFPTRRISSF